MKGYSRLDKGKMFWRSSLGLLAIVLALIAQSYIYRRAYIPKDWWQSDGLWIFAAGAVLLALALPATLPKSDGKHKVPLLTMVAIVLYIAVFVAGLTLSQAGKVSLTVVGAVLVASGLVIIATALRLSHLRALVATVKRLTGPSRNGPLVAPAAGFVLFGVLLVAVAIAYWWKNSLANDGAILWGLGILAIIVGFWRLEKPGNNEPCSRRALLWDAAAVLAILAVAVYMRGYELADIPFGSWYDEAESGLEAVEILKGKAFSPMATFTFNPSLLFYLIAASFKVFGVNLLAIRLVTAAVGALAAVALYFLVKNMFDRHTGFVAGMMLAVSAWHVNFSRFGMPNITATLLELIALFFFVRGLQTRRRMLFLWAGVATGLGLYSYTAFRLIPLVMAFLAVYWLVAERDHLGTHIQNLAVFGLLTAIVAAPLGLYAVQHAREFGYRTEETSVFAKLNTDGAKMKALDNSLRRHLLMFNYQGDPNGRHGLPGAPMLDFASGALLVLGLGYSLYHWRRWPHFLGVSWLLIAMLAGILSLDWEAPQGARTVVAIPALFVLAAIPVGKVWASATQLPSRVWKLAAAVLVVGLLAYIAQANYIMYFEKQMKSNEVWVSFSSRETVMARYINKLGDGYRIYFQNPNAPIVRLIANRQQDFHGLWTMEDLPIKERPTKDIAFLFEPWRVATPPSEFLRYYPNATLDIIRDLNGDIAVYAVVVKKEDILKIQGLEGKYYAPGQSEPFLSRTDPTISFDWGKDPALADRPFRAEWTGSLYVPTPGQYTFNLDGGGKGELWLDGQQLLGGESAATEAKKYLPKGLHSIRVTIESPNGQGASKLAWAPPGAGRDAIPQVMLTTVPLSPTGLTGRYYQGPEWKGEPQLVQIDQALAFRWHQVPLGGQWSAEWRGKINIPDKGNYTFATYTSDRAWVIIDDKPVITGAPSNATGQIALEKGMHDIVVKYVDTKGYSEFRVMWVPAGQDRQLIPDSILFPN